MHAIFKKVYNAQTCFIADTDTLTLESISLKKLHEGIRGGGGREGQSDPSPPLFDAIHPIDLIFGTYNELSL